jgi:hypothetical protein
MKILKNINLRKGAVARAFRVEVI